MLKKKKNVTSRFTREHVEFRRLLNLFNKQQKKEDPKALETMKTIYKIIANASNFEYADNVEERKLRGKK